jgi:colanic acid/amylovoran biosynthesis glycosyltransferase
VSSDSAVPVRVVHSLPVWLPRTSPWLFQLVHDSSVHVDNHVACESTANLDQFEFPRIHCLRGISPWRYALYRASRSFSVRQYFGFSAEVARSVGARILHSHWGDVAWKDSLSAKRAGLKQVVTFYGKDVNHLPQKNAKWRRRYKTLFQRVELVLCEGPFMAEAIHRLGCPREKIRVHHLGVATGSIAFRPRVWRPGETLKILIAASFREKKGIPDALAAIGEFGRDYPGIEVSVIGDADKDPRSQPEKQRILDVVKQYGLERKVKFLGYQPYAVLFDEAYRHHVFISPSLTASDGDTEGGAPVTLIDMAASGMPIISTTHCDIPAVIVHEKTGLLAGERDVSGLVRHLRWLAANPERWHAMTEMGRRHIETEFDSTKQATRLADFYRDLAAA